MIHQRRDTRAQSTQRRHTSKQYCLRKPRLQPNVPQIDAQTEKYRVIL